MGIQKCLIINKQPLFLGLYRNRYMDTQSIILLTFINTRKSTYFVPCTLVSRVLNINTFRTDSGMGSSPIP
jgi:hypothetical protein